LKQKLVSYFLFLRSSHYYYLQNQQTYRQVSHIGSHIDLYQRKISRES